MDKYIITSYTISLILLFLCVLLLRIAANKNKYLQLVRHLIRVFGVLPGFIGVFAGIYLQLKFKDPGGFAVMTAWLILELGSVQTLNILRTIENKLPGTSDPA